MTGTEQSPTAPAEAEKRTAHEPGGKSSSLLLRIAQHLRNQHWVAIGIEFLVVIFGVFLGFQLTSWNEARQQADIERAMLIRLGEELNLLESDLADACKNSTPLSAARAMS